MASTISGEWSAQRTIAAPLHDTADVQHARGDIATACRVSLIIPCYNGGTGLRRTLGLLGTWIEAQPSDVEVILSDDGSDGDHAALLAEFARAHPGRVRLIGDGVNRGKGAAVVNGFRAATGSVAIFTDSDLAYPLSQVDRVIAALDRGADVAIANRIDAGSRYLMSPRFIPYLFSRHVASRLLNRVVQLLLVPGIEDTQAGLKGFRRAAYHTIAEQLSIHGFAFDIEALVIARAHGMRVVSVPVEFRYDNEPSTVRYIRDALRMIRDMSRIFWNRLRGAYA